MFEQGWLTVDEGLNSRNPLREPRDVDGKVARPEGASKTVLVGRRVVEAHLAEGHAETVEEFRCFGEHLGRHALLANGAVDPACTLAQAGEHGAPRACMAFEGRCLAPAIHADERRDALVSGPAPGLGRVGEVEAVAAPPSGLDLCGISAWNFKQLLVAVQVGGPSGSDDRELVAVGAHVDTGALGTHEARLAELVGEGVQDHGPQSVDDVAPVTKNK